MARQLGGYADEQIAGGLTGNGRIWIKNIPKGDTRIRFCQPTRKFYKWYEHYVDGPGAFACDNDSKCPGCTSTDSDEQSRRLKYGFNCIDQSGRLVIYKCGPKLFEKLQRKEKFYDGTLMDRDWILQRVGERLETEYDAEPGKQYDIEFPEKIYLIKNLVFQDFFAAMDAFEIKYDPMEAAEFDEMWTDFEPAWITGGEAEPTKAKAAKAAKADEGEAQEVVEGSDIRSTTRPSTWTTAELREYLKVNDVEFGSAAPRTRLVALADAHMAENPPFSGATAR